MNAVPQSRLRLVSKLGDMRRPVLVGRRDDFQKGDDLMSAHMSDRERAPQATIRRGEGQFVAHLGRRFGDRKTAFTIGGRRGVRPRRLECQYVDEEWPRMLFGQRIVSRRQQTAVQGFAQVSKPRCVKGMEGPSIDQGPVVNRHVQSSACEWGYSTPEALAVSTSVRGLRRNGTVDPRRRRVRID